MNENEKTLPKTEAPDGLPGVVLVERKRCRKANCRCRSGEDADLHGPYFYRYWRQGGRLRKAYVPRRRVDAVRAACQRRQEREREERASRAAFRAALRRFRERAREVERALAAWKELRRHNP